MERIFTGAKGDKVVKAIMTAYAAMLKRKGKEVRISAEKRD